MRTVSVILIIMIMLCGCADISGLAEYSDTRLLMDTVCTIKAGGENAQAAVSKAFEIIEEIDAAVDYYSDSSEVSAVNRAVSGESIAVSCHTFEIIKTALDISEKSGGAFDITTAPLKDLWGFSSGDHKPPADSEIAEVMALVGYNRITLDEENKTVTKSADGVKIDLGGAAKGYAADVAAEVMRENGAEYGLIDLGGNVVAFGKNPKRADGKWLIAIQKPFAESGEYSQTVLIEDGAVVTSGNYQRYFEWEGKRYHHILNPKNGMPTDSGISGASIVTDSALVADCLSTACMVLGKEQGESLAAEYGAELISEE